MSEPVAPATCTLSIVVPVYNGAASVGELVEALSDLAVPGGLEIVLVNDGSPDDSLAVCRRLLETARVPLVVVDHARNFGEHNAVMTGLRHAGGRYILTMDDDLQNPPEEVLRILEHAQKNELDVVYTYYETKEHALWRNLGSRFTNWCADRLLDKPKGLYLSSFRCMSRFAAQAIGRYDGPFPYVDGLLLQVTKRIGRIQVRHLPRAVGRSNYTLRRLVRLWMNMFLNFSVMPLRAATLLGLGFSALGGLAGLVVIVEALINQPPAGWASLMAATLLVSGVQLVMLGMIGEYLGRLFLTVNRKPQGIVRTVYRNGAEAGETP
ncbi:undecaprenyl-phosphate 4-deoxy-4-formamido-L-arabinose transferase [Stella humosa]|uniref:Undecaprenyl-phosphate 4-deoxy-4-formamido-L-arabinose transferase n=1 Tax=Stella humosa TaxID=94 RepID=A0A3N1MIZ8_9PROT|nr:glycosyltransferase family 2 protein [Stella humosa]ROQ03309.1 undecaprenyl-phosphate 4-deoxy-4-formamido-L-arabinose transferase [Stella humosa]BBK33320.1 glycosyl transferase [Stella humosa]